MESISSKLQAFATQEGYFSQDIPWLSTDWGVNIRNPWYKGEPVPPPEDDPYIA